LYDENEIKLLMGMEKGSEEHDMRQTRRCHGCCTIHNSHAGNGQDSDAIVVEAEIVTPEFQGSTRKLKHATEK
jgi:hypothetical protein